MSIGSYVKRSGVSRPLQWALQQDAASPLFTALPGKALPLGDIADKKVGMDKDRLARAMARIEAATTRIEAAAGPLLAGDAQLQARFDHLRSETGAALVDLDALLAKLAP